MNDHNKLNHDRSPAYYALTRITPTDKLKLLALFDETLQRLHVGIDDIDDSFLFLMQHLHSDN